jgi:DNA-binding GntR family transcriptional regulator
MNKSTVKELKAIQKRSLSGLVYEELKRMILSGKIEQGARINESELAKDMRISRGPVREACRLLENSGLVKFIPNMGTFIQTVDRQELADLYDIQAALDALAGEKAAKKFQASNLTTLIPLIEKMEILAENEDEKKYSDLNLKFHFSIIKISGNRRLHDLYESNHMKTALFQNALVAGNKSRLKKSQEEHKMIVAALTHNDCQKASALARFHALSDKSALLAVLTHSLS